jgi:hypothetical protein
MRYNFEEPIDWRARNATATRCRQRPATARLIHALEGPRPAARHCLNLPARAAAGLKRLLSTRALDLFLRGR